MRECAGQLDGRIGTTHAGVGRLEDGFVNRVAVAQDPLDAGLHRTLKRRFDPRHQFVQQRVQLRADRFAIRTGKRGIGPRRDASIASRSRDATSAAISPRSSAPSIR
jgi:hypothetical protein